VEGKGMQVLNILKHMLFLGVATGAVAIVASPFIAVFAPVLGVVAALGMVVREKYLVEKQGEGV
jgi:hypothetical protein